jgi:hypothetical protein
MLQMSSPTVVRLYKSSSLCNPAQPCILIQHGIIILGFCDSNTPQQCLNSLLRLGARFMVAKLIVILTVINTLFLRTQLPPLH